MLSAVLFAAAACQGTSDRAASPAAPSTTPSSGPGRSMLLSPEQVIPTAIAAPTLTVAPASGNQLTTFTLTGAHYTANGAVNRFLQLPGQAWEPLGSITATSTGTLAALWTFQPGCSTAAGIAHAYAVDVHTGHASPTVVEPIAAAAGCAGAASVADITFPAHSGVRAGTSFTKTWRLTNTGTAAWTNDTLVFHSTLAHDRLTGPSSVAIPTTAAGATVDISVTLSTASPTCAAKDDVWVVKNAAGTSLSGGTAAVVVTAIPATGPNLGSPSYGLAINPFTASGLGGQDTAFVWGRANEVLGSTALPTGNASTWYAATTLRKGPTAKARSVAVWGASPTFPNGHVAFVETVGASTVTITEANYDCHATQTAWGGGYDGHSKVLTPAQLMARPLPFLGYVYLQ
jgi:surface antigen